MDDQHAPPNHHADYPGFKGVAGLSPRSAWPSVARAMRSLPSTQRHGIRRQVVDIGCGPGVAVRYSARLGATVIGVDPAPVMLRVARLLTRGSAKVRYARVPLRTSPLPRVLLRSCGRSPPCTIGRTSTPAFEKYAKCSSPVAVWSPWSGGQNEVPRGHGSHGWTDEQATTLRIDAANTALPTFVWSGQRSDADQRSAW